MRKFKLEGFCMHIVSAHWMRISILLYLMFCVHEHNGVLDHRGVTYNNQNTAEIWQLNASNRHLLYSVVTCGVHIHTDALYSDLVFETHSNQGSGLEAINTLWKVTTPENVHSGNWYIPLYGRQSKQFIVSIKPVFTT